MRLLLLVGAAVLLWLILRGMGQAAAASPASDGDDDLPTKVPANAPGGNDALDNIAEAMARFEGFYLPNGSVASRTNNPGNIGNYSGNTNTFADVGDGWDALYDWITSHASAHPDWSFSDLINYYVNGSTTDTSQNAGPYAQYVADYVGVDPSTPVSQVIGG